MKYLVLYRRYGQIEVEAESAAQAVDMFDEKDTAEIDANLGSTGEDFEVTEVMIEEGAEQN